MGVIHCLEYYRVSTLEEEPLVLVPETVVAVASDAGDLLATLPGDLQRVAALAQFFRPLSSRQKRRPTRSA